MGFSENLRDIRKSRRMTQNQLATKLGVRRQTIIDWENPEGKRPGFFHLTVLVTALEVSWNKLMDGEVQQLKSELPEWRKATGMVAALQAFAKVSSALSAQTFGESRKEVKNK